MSGTQWWLVWMRKRVINIVENEERAEPKWWSREMKRHGKNGTEELYGTAFRFPPFVSTRSSMTWTCDPMKTNGTSTLSSTLLRFPSSPHKQRNTYIHTYVDMDMHIVFSQLHTFFHVPCSMYLIPYKGLCLFLDMLLLVSNTHKSHRTSCTH